MRVGIVRLTNKVESCNQPFQPTQGSIGGALRSTDWPRRVLAVTLATN